MIAEQQRYQWQSWLVSMTATAIVALVAGLGLLAWPVVQRTMGNSDVTCGCGIVQVHQSTWLTITAASFFGLAMIVIISTVGRLFWLARQAQRYQRELHRFGTRLVTHEQLQTTYRLVQTTEHLAVTIGWYQPTMYLSQGTLKTLSASEVRAVLIHERAHQQARDPLVAALTDSLTWVLRWLPGGREWVRQAATWRELAADAAATNGYRSTVALSSAFLKFQPTSVVVGAGFSANSDRLEKLLDHTWRPAGSWRRWMTPLVVGAVVVLSIMLGRFVRASTPSAPVVAQACHETLVRCEQPHTQPPATTIRCSVSSCVTEERHATSVYGRSQ